MTTEKTAVPTTPPCAKANCTHRRHSRQGHGSAQGWGQAQEGGVGVGADGVGEDARAQRDVAEVEEGRAEARDLPAAVPHPPRGRRGNQPDWTGGILVPEGTKMSALCWSTIGGVCRSGDLKILA